MPLLLGTILLQAFTRFIWGNNVGRRIVATKAFGV
jgi:multisubunit Na+/H+ antiporter MnhF subunit